VQEDTRRATEPPVPARDEQVDPIRNVVAQLEQSERALVRDDGLLCPDRHPPLADVVVLGRREASNAIEPAPQALEASLLDVMVQELTADAVLTRLLGGEIAALLVCLDFETAKVRLLVMHK
jgi:hypothetical protein